MESGVLYSGGTGKARWAPPWNRDAGTGQHDQKPPENPKRRKNPQKAIFSPRF